jgi:ribose 5-phosphate isomerase B
MKIAIGGDHAGFDYKQEIIKLLVSRDIEVKNFGAFSTESVDYPDYAHPLSEAVSQGEFDFGILICGSGNGVCMVANKYQNIRAALCWNEELISLAREHNNANILCLPARFISLEEAKKFIQVFLDTKFEGGRHERRTNKIPLS